MQRLLYIIALLLIAQGTIAKERKTAIDWVNPNIGAAHSRWFFYTPGASPFGMAKPGPTTDGHLGNKYGWDACGYDQRHTSIEGFVNFHEFQIGGIALMPTVGTLQTIPGALDNPEEGFRSNFRHETEIAQPGYYKVELDDYMVKAELTSTDRVAFHKYTFPKSDKAHILFNVGHRQGESGEVTDAFAQMTSDTEIVGFVSTAPEYVRVYQTGANIKMYFVARLNKAPKSFGGFQLEKVTPKATASYGKGSGIYLDFETEEGEAIEVKIGLSYTSIDNAIANLTKEANNMNFDEAKKQSQAKWENMLNKIAIKGGTEADRTKFYTGLYHSLLGRGLSSDCNGAYPRNDGKIGQIKLNPEGKPQYNHYNTDAVWGAFWNLTQLWTMAYPDYMSQFVQTQLDIYKDTGWLADGIACSKFVSGVGTNFTGLIIAAAHNRGIRNFNDSLAYEAVRKNELGSIGRIQGAGKADVGAFLELGYSPFQIVDAYYTGTTSTGSNFSASHTLEYSFSAYAAAQMAKSMEKTEDYNRLMQLSKGWEQLYDNETAYIRPKDREGKFLTPFDPAKAWDGYQEGNAFQYTFYVPHAPELLINKIGEEKFVTRLDNLFKASSEQAFGGGKTIDAFAGVGGVYNHGNQPSLHISWLFNYAKRPDLTQYWVRRICNEFYGTDGIHGYGYGQDEDQGQLGAWYVLASMGLFDVKGGTSENSTIQLATPLFSEVRIELDQNYYKGKEFVIKTKGNPTKNVYTKSVTFNNKSITTPWIHWSDFTNGGVVEIETKK